MGREGPAAVVNPCSKLAPLSAPSPALCTIPAVPRAPSHLTEEVAVRRVTRRAQRAEVPVYWNFKDSIMRGRRPPPPKYSILSALRIQYRDETLSPQVPAEGSTPGWGWAGKGYSIPGRSWDRRGDVHPHPLPRSLCPGTWCRPLGWAGRQGSCNSEWVGSGMGGTLPRCPMVGGRAGRGHASH